MLQCMALCILMLPLVPCTVPSTGEEAMHIANVMLANSDWLYLQAISIILTIRPVCEGHRLCLPGAVAEAQLTLDIWHHSYMLKNNIAVPVHVHCCICSQRWICSCRLHHAKSAAKLHGNCTATAW